MEVLIAFAIATVVMGSLVYGVAGAVRSDLRAKASLSQLRLAQSRLEAAGVDQPLRPGVLEGEVDGVRWRQRTSRVKSTLLLVPASTKGSPQPAAELYWVEVAFTGKNGAEVRFATSKVVMARP